MSTKQQNLYVLALVLAGVSCSSNYLADSAAAPDLAVTAAADTTLLCSADADQDGISNKDEGAFCTEAVFQKLFFCLENDTNPASINARIIRQSIDTDEDGTPDFQDLDSDSDGLSDLAESKGPNLDLDGDGRCDTTCVIVAQLPDTDQSGTPDYLDTDSDNNQVSDLLQKGASCTSSDGVTCDASLVEITFKPVTATDIAAIEDINDTNTNTDTDKDKTKDTETKGPSGSSGSDLTWRYSKLTSLTLSAGTLSPAVDDTITSHTAAVSVSSITVTPTAVHSGATITVNGTPVSSGSASGSISLSLGTNTITLLVTKSGVPNTTYTLTVTRSIAQEATMTASTADASDLFGYSIAISGDTLVVGTREEDSNATGINGDQSNNLASNSGAAYVFIRSGSTWTQQAYLKASNTEANDLFGYSVGISGETIVVAARSEDSNATGVNGDQSNNLTDGSGAAYVFTRSGTTWTQQAYLKASNTGAQDQFGYFIAISGDTIVVGAIEEDSNATGINGDQSNNLAGASGAAYVFTRSGTTWTQQAYIKASNAATYFGFSVAITGDDLVVGSPFEDGTATDSGAAYVFTRSGTTWTQQAYIKASNPGVDDRFGSSVSILGNDLIVGATNEDSNATGVGGDQSNNSAADAGAAYVYVRSGTTWTQQAYLKASNTGAGDLYGVAVAISGNTAVVSAYAEDSNATGVNGDQSNNSASDSGAAYVYTRSGTTWTQQAYLKASNTAASDAFGFSSAISSDTIAIGAYGKTGARGASYIFK